MDSDSVDEDYGADEDYEPNAGTTSQNQNQTVDDANAGDGIAGLNLDLGSVQPPTGPDLVMPARPGARSANFRQVGRMFPQEPDQAQERYDDDDFGGLLNGNGDDVANVVDRLMRYQIARQIGPNAEQVLNRIQPQPRAYAAQELTQIRQRRQDQRQQQQLRIILQNCDRHRLLRLFASIDRAHDERALRRVLQQLDHILEMPQQISRNWGGINDVTRSHSHAFERLRCRTPQARRALHAFISGVRNHLRSRLHAMTARRRPPQTQTQSQSQSRKGGKRQTKTKKRAFKRNKTVKRR